MSVVSLQGRDATAEARALLHAILEHGEIAGTDHAGRTIIQLAVDPYTLDRLLTFDADAVETEDGGDDEPYQCLPMSACWFWEGGEEFFGAARDDLVPPKRIRRAMRGAPTVALALLLVIMPRLEARADQTSIVAPLPRSPATGEVPAQCCRICTKGHACGDGCISAQKQCKKEPGCACAVGSDGEG